MNVIVSIIASAMLTMIVSGIIRSLRSTKDEAVEKPLEETSDMKLRRAYRNAYFMQMSLADEAKTLKKIQTHGGKTNDR